MLSAVTKVFKAVGQSLALSGAAFGNLAASAGAETVRTAAQSGSALVSLAGSAGAKAVETTAEGGAAFVQLTAETVAGTGNGLHIATRTGLSEVSFKPFSQFLQDLQGKGAKEE